MKQHAVALSVVDVLFSHNGNVLFCLAADDFFGASIKEWYGKQVKWW